MSLSVSRLVCSIVVLCGAVFALLALGDTAAFAAAPETPNAEVQSYTDTSGHLQGVLSPGGLHPQEGTYEFLYAASPTSCSGGNRSKRGLSFGFGGEGVSEEIGGLLPHTAYTVCLLDRNIAGEETLSAPVTFTTSFEPEAPVTGTVSAITASTAVLHGMLNPNSERASEPGFYELVYRRSSSECEGEGAESTGQLAVEHGGTKGEAIEHEVAGLSANTQYAFCVRAWNATGQHATGSPVTFTTLSREPAISEEGISRVGLTTTTVNARVEPGGLATEYSVQYGTSDAYGSESNLANVTVASTVSIALNGLQPSTEYHFRFVATNAEGTVQGSDHTFTTYPEVASSLPDGRVYELVSSLNTPDSELFEMNRGSLSVSELVYQAAADGGALAYPGLLSSTQGGDGSTNEYRAVRGPQGGWTQTNISPAVQSLLYTGAYHYDGFSNDLSVGFFNALVRPPLQDTVSPAEGEGIVEGEDPSKKLYALYLRSFSDGLFEPLFTTMPLYPRCCGIHENQFGGTSQYGGMFDTAIAKNNEAGLIVAGASTDHGEVLFGANDALLEGKGALENELDLDVAEETKLSNEAGAIEVEVRRLGQEKQQLPLGSPERIEKSEEEYLKNGEAEALEVGYGATENRNELYVSSHGALSLVNVSPEGRLLAGATFGGELPGPWKKNKRVVEEYSHAISADGSRIFWQSRETMPGVYVRVDDSHTEKVSAGSGQYWTASDDGRYAYYTEAGKLWRFDVDSEARSEIAGAGGGVLGVIGTNETGEDGAYLYFVSTEALGGSNAAGVAASAGADNLYLAEPDRETGGQRIVFIASLSSADASDWAEGIGWRTAEMAPDGRGLVFTASENLLGHPYPNENAGEVYVFEAANSSLACASCGSNASGGRLVASESRIYQYRWISEDGDRVFFESEAPLVYNDINGQYDAYEWERDGSGECTQAQGCIYLLSAGGIEGPSFFVDASTSGDDVFIETRQRLVGEADGEATEIYDARVNGARAVQPPACTGTGCQGAPSPPLPFSTPASVTFAGVGNFPSPPSAPVSKTVKKKASKCVKSKKHGKTRTCKRQNTKAGHGKSKSTGVKGRK